jgi:protein phosphatase
MPDIHPESSHDVSRFLEVFKQTTSNLVAERSRGRIVGGVVSGGLVEIRELDNLAIIGDLHGDLRSLDEILQGIRQEEFLANPRNKIIFLGDYVDRGSDSLGVLYSVCQLKNGHPDSVVLMCGNHEAPSEFPFSSHDLPYRIVERFGQSKGKEIYDALLIMFRELTVATIVTNRLLLVHGGLPTEDAAILNHRNALATARERRRVLEELLWNDPRHLDDFPYWEESQRGLGRYFGEPVTRKWLKAFGVRVLLRGHEPCQGFRINHDGKVMTLFSCQEAYPAFKAAYLVVTKEKLDTAQSGNDLLTCIKFVGNHDIEDSANE